MSQFNKLKNNNFEWYSDSFYTNNKGYRMYLQVDAAGVLDGKSTHLSVFLYIMKGSYDDELTWPLKGKFEMKLLNQISDSGHSKTLTYYDDNDVPHKSRSKVTQCDRAPDGWGYSQFISIVNLWSTTSTCQRLKEDCLFFQVQ